MCNSPLEQFKPVSFLSTFIGGINLSITNISFMFVFMVCIISFLLKGNLFYFDRLKSVDYSLIDNNPKMLSSRRSEALCTGKLDLTFNDFYIILERPWKGSEFRFDNFFNFYYKRALNIKSGVSKEINLFKFVDYNKHDTFNPFLIPSVIILIFEFFYSFILDQVKSVITGDTKLSVKFFPLAFLLFVFILLANLLGMIPYSSTVTAYLIITMTLAFMVNIGVTIYALKIHGLHWFSFFLPEGVPVILWPLLITIELVSYLVRVVSLSVRLFANMMAGHTLLAVLAGFGWTMATTGILLFLVHPLPVLVVFILVGLELAIACIQAFVFTLLTLIYINDAVNLH